MVTTEEIINNVAMQTHTSEVQELMDRCVELQMELDKLKDTAKSHGLCCMCENRVDCAGRTFTAECIDWKYDEGL